MRTKLATAARWAAQRPRTDQQGIALQTVIVIVVMLVIAGGVSGVLLSRGGEVISDLENADTSAAEINSQDECTAAGRNLLQKPRLGHGTGTQMAEGAYWVSGSDQCVITGDSSASNKDELFTRFSCEQYRGADGSRGVFEPDTVSASTFEKCTIG